MGTNFYLFSQDKDTVCRWFSSDEYTLTDEPEFGYQIHVAKTSAGWLPLFQGYRQLRSVKALAQIVQEGHFQILDEYGNSYDWAAFSRRVLSHNGGVAGVLPPKKIDQSDLPEWMRDPDMPDHTPVSHFEYAHGKYAGTLFKDPQGYEFDTREFC